MPKITQTEEQYIKILLNRIKEKTVYEGECWRYTGKHVGNGYASITYRNKTVRLNRFIAYVYYGLPIDAYLYSAKQACHTAECKFRDCWRPEHIYLGTPAENVADQIKAGTFHNGRENLQGGKNFNEEKWLESQHNKYK